MKKIFLLFMVLLFAYPVYTQVTQVKGVTIDAISPLPDIVTSLQNLPVKPTTRIVFDEWVPATDYLNACNSISNVSFIMGEILDSYYMKDYTVAQYSARVNEYMNTLGSKVNIWEIGNEINGEWLGNQADVIAKMTNAYNIVKSAGKTTALTLYYNKQCWANPNNEMFLWAQNNVPSYMKTGLDYVWVSYYEDDCNNYQPNWQQVFDQLHAMFPNAKIGIGECGTFDPAKKQAYMTRYYSMNITTPNYVGGYFWWFYRQDCVPMTKPLWTTLKNLLGTTPQLTAPVLISPVNGATNVSTTPVLDWSDVVNSASYRVQVSTSSAFSSTVVNQSSLMYSTYTVPAGVLTAGTTYYFRAAASNSTSTGPWSNVFSFTTASVPPPVTNQIRGVTIDGIYPTADIVNSLKYLPVKPTTRIIFDRSSSSIYLNAVAQISAVSNIMGSVMDAYYINYFTVDQYRARINDYMWNFGDKVSIWEVANDFNAEEVGSITNAAAMLNAGYNYVKSLNKKTAITLRYNSYCTNNPALKTFTWANNNIPQYIRNGLDYVWLSYYDESCNNINPNWQQVFDSLRVMFPNAKIGIGEVGTLDPNKKAAFMQKYYTMNITTPNYVGGYFWWTFRQDCVPMTNPLWTTLKNVFAPPLDNITGNKTDNPEIPSSFELKQNYPNPFNPSTKISYSIPSASLVKLVVYDMQGKEIMTLTNEYMQAGSYTAEFNASNLASGVYVYRIEAGTFRDVKKMILIK